MDVISAALDSTKSQSLQGDETSGSESGSGNCLAQFPQLAQLAPNDGKTVNVKPLSQPNALELAETLVKNLSSIESVLAFTIFCQIVLNIDKKLIGGNSDPTQTIMQLVVDEANMPFWKASKHDSNEKYLGAFSGRCRSLISVYCRHGKFAPIISVLQVLIKLNLTPKLFTEFNLLEAMESVISQSDNTDATALARRLANKYQKLQPGNTTSKQSTPAPKLFGDGGALSMRTLKRTREPATNTSTASSPSVGSPPVSSASTQQDSATDVDMAVSDENESSEDIQPRKKAKGTKRVHWKAESELVSVRYFTMEGVAKFKSAKNARMQEHEEATVMHTFAEWTTPKLIDFQHMPVSEQFRQLMSTKRGGLKEPESEDATVQEQREAKVPRVVYAENTGVTIPDSPLPPNPVDTVPESGWTPRVGGKFIPAQPSPQWLQKKGGNANNNSVNTQQAMPNPMGAPMGAPMGMHNPGIPPMMGMPPMMPAFAWGMNPMMGMNMSTAQMSEFMKMNSSMFGKPSQG